MSITSARDTLAGGKPVMDGNEDVPAVPLVTTHANGFVAAGVEKCCTRFDHREMHDVFIVISESGEGEHNARTGACHEAVARLRALVYLQPFKRRMYRSRLCNWRKAAARVVVLIRRE